MNGGPGEALDDTVDLAPLTWRRRPRKADRGRWHASSGRHLAARDLGPDLKGSHPGGAVLGSSDMIAAEMEKVVDLIWAERKRCA